MAEARPRHHESVSQGHLVHQHVLLLALLSVLHAQLPYKKSPCRALYNLESSHICVSSNARFPRMSDWSDILPSYQNEYLDRLQTGELDLL